MVGQAVRTAIDPSDARGCGTYRRERMERSSAPAATDRFARQRRAPRPAAWQRLLRDAENFGGEVSFPTPLSLPIIPSPFLVQTLFYYLAPKKDSHTPKTSLNGV